MAQASFIFPVWVQPFKYYPRLRVQVLKSCNHHAMTSLAQEYDPGLCSREVKGWKKGQEAGAAGILQFH